jgi:hypothetical protein
LSSGAEKLRRANILPIRDMVVLLERKTEVSILNR